ncbi:DUF5615 family PIN-like protein [Thermodesulfovibrio hydrogeniphilus]
MPIKLLIDESVDYRLVIEMDKKGIEVISIVKNYRGISDKEVLNLAKKFNAVLITEDKDFGEWIFAHKKKFRGDVVNI